jgi:hypothetical protein
LCGVAGEPPVRSGGSPDLLLFFAAVRKSSPFPCPARALGILGDRGHSRAMVIVRWLTAFFNHLVASWRALWRAPTRVEELHRAILATEYTYYPTANDVEMCKNRRCIGKKCKEGTYVALYLNNLVPPWPRSLQTPHVTLEYLAQFDTYEALHECKFKARALLAGQSLTGVHLTFASYPRSKNSLMLRRGSEAFALARMLQASLPHSPSGEYARGNWQLHVSLC